MTTLNDMRHLLEYALKHDNNPAIKRLPESERTVEGVVGAYLPRHISIQGLAYPIDTTTLLDLADEKWPTWADEWRAKSPVLSDPGTAHGLLVGFALYLGLDPGEGGLGVMWCEVRDHTVEGWAILTQGDAHYFVPPEMLTGDSDETAAPEVVAEPDARKALALAVKHVLGDTP